MRVGRSRGSQTSPSVIANNDLIGGIIGQAFDGSYFRNAAKIDFYIDGTPGTKDLPGRIAFATSPDGSDALQERMRITSTGDVGIGTTSPSYTLHVNGTIGTTNSGQVHSDYVFEPDYKLKSLEKLEEYIKTEKHLPGIITDPKKVPEVDILAFSGKLLAKIEELTLYTIAQQKEIKAQRKRNDDLEARLAKLESLLK